MKAPKSILPVLSVTLLLLTTQLQAAPPADWHHVTETANFIKIDTDQLESVIPKRNPKHWMTGIEKGSFLDKKTGFREVGDGLMVIDWLMEAGSDEAYGKEVFAPDGHGVGRYTGDGF